MAVTDRIRDLVAPLAEAMELDIYDIELNGGNLRVTVDGPDGVLLDQLARLTKAFSHVLDEEDPMPGKYTLEVSSPGLERRLRTPEHFAGAVGEEISLKLAPHVDGDRRRRGLLAAATEQQITLVDEDGAEHVLGVDDITKATTVFEWGPTPKPGSGSAKSTSVPEPNTSKQKTGGDVGVEPNPSDDSERRAAVQ